MELFVQKVDENFKENEPRYGLCFRCEHRAQFYEQGHAPRCECGDTTSAVWNCYMYSPIRPCVTSPAYPKDKRPRFGGWMIASREGFVRVANKDDVELKLNMDKKEAVLSWVGKDKTKYKEVEVEIGDEEFMQLAKNAHDKNLTLNEYVNELLITYMDEQKKVKKSKKAKK